MEGRQESLRDSGQINRQACLRQRLDSRMGTRQARCLGSPDSVAESMKLQYFGDSYDIVKKSMLAWLADFGPWSAHPMFTHAVNEADAAAFSAFLGIPLVSTEVLRAESDRLSYLAACGDCRSVFLDPDTGVRLRRQNGKRSAEFVFGDELVAIASTRPTGLVLTFDQSLARGSEAKQILEKLTHFVGRGLHGFAYVSHASFMVLGPSQGVVSEAKTELIRRSGLPTQRIVNHTA